MNNNTEYKSIFRTDLKKGQILDSGFVILDVLDLDELKGTGIWAKHEKCGTEVFHILNSDDENLFSFAFATSPDDSTGAPHILEHSVLCGSERYPLKDAFIVLAQGSLQTFLNALTFPDKTIYPASSVNEHDYFNLMSVYGEAVFRPLLPEWTFMQEGHRLEYNDGKLSITGIVYNEMKGAYSSLDAYANLWSVKAVMPGTPYAFESGGDPEAIPQLTWEGLKEFHRARYSPSNCKIFLAGNIPTEKQLAFLNAHFFSSLSGGSSCEPVKKTERWKEPRKFHIPCPAGSECKSTIFLSWLCCDIADTDEILALAALTEILLGHDGSPLTRALIESGLGEDIAPVTGFEGEIRETLFVAGLKSVEGDAQQMSTAVEGLVTGELRRLVKEGIPEQEIEAALLALEFSQREIRRSGGPFSLVWMRRSLRAWLHGCKPWESLLIQGPIAKLKENIKFNNRYFESLIEKYLLNNPHRALVIIEPRDDFLTKQEEILSQSLSDMVNKMSEDEKRQITEKTKELEKIQSEADTSEVLASIPHLSRSDLFVKDDFIPRRYDDLRGVPALCHDLYTNGITYIDLSFPVDIFPDDDYPWLLFFSRAAVSVGLPGMDYGEVSSLMARTVGSLNALLHTGSAVRGAPLYLQTASGNFDLSGRDWITYRMKCLDEKTAPSLDFTLRIIDEADFSDARRINDLVLEMKNEIDSSLAPMGHIYASGRAGRFNSRSKNIEEKWGGISQISFAHQLVKLNTGEIIKKLQYIKERIISSGLIVNITGSALDDVCRETSLRFGKFGPPLPRLQPDALTNGSTLQEQHSPKAEVFASKSLQVGFAAVTLTSALYDTPEQVAESVLTHQLSTGALWEDIRMKGGAYGAFINNNSLENCLSFATYRDPNPMRSLDAISLIFKDSSYGKCSEDYLEKSIIGCYSKETRPRTAAEDGLIDFYRFLYDIQNSHWRRKLERLISVSTMDIETAFSSLNSRGSSGPVIIAGIKKAEEAAKALGTDVQMLPV
ncbi:MAG: insulinase family protein [Treponema sp.]|nr:insulinase family protein [Treponema sp.]